MFASPFLIGFIIMSLGSLAIYARGSKQGDELTPTLIHAAVPFIAATSYLAMAGGVGTFVGPTGIVTFVARYADWVVTTPLLLTALVLTALGERARSAGFLIALITLDVLMIVTGLLSSLAIIPSAKLIWYLWSCAAFAGIFYLLWGPLMKRASEGGRPLAYRRNLLFLTVVWLAYPVVFALGTEWFGVIGTLPAAWAILVLDVTAKVVFAFYAAHNREHDTRHADPVVMQPVAAV